MMFGGFIYSLWRLLTSAVAQGLLPNFTNRAGNVAVFHGKRV